MADTCGSVIGMEAYGSYGPEGQNHHNSHGLVGEEAARVVRHEAAMVEPVWFCHSMNSWDPTEAPGVMEWVDGVHPGDRAALMPVLQRLCACASGGQRDEATVRYRVKHREHWVAVEARLGAIPGGKPPYFRLVGIEEHAGAQRPSDEAVDIRLAQHAELMNTAVHDLRAPLTVLSASLSLLKVRPATLSPEVRDELMTRMERSCLRMERMLRGLMDAAAADAGHLHLQPRPVAITPFLQGFVANYRCLAESKNMLLGWAPVGEIPGTFNMDDSLVEQVLENLVSNAIKFCSKGAVIRVFLSATADGLLEFAVEDDGPGIAPEEQPSLFVPFYRARTRPSGGEQSTGLGLAICARLVEAHGGTMWLESALGEGSTFHFTVKAAEAEQLE